VTPARRLAFDVLIAVEAGGFASDLLQSSSQGMTPRDAGLATEIVMGSLRRRAELDALISQGARRDIAGMDIEVRTALRMGAYQLLHLSRVPDHAAVSESVDLVRRAGRTSAAGLVNAVLRHLKEKSIQLDRPTALNLPYWLMVRWDKLYGASQTDAIAQAALQQPETFIRSVSGGEGLTATEVEGCWLVTGVVPQGLNRQDIGSQALVPLLELESGQRFLDVCAAPGNKTIQAQEYGVRAVACDSSLRRLTEVRRAKCDLVQLNAAAPLPFLPVFDRILVDAPCSGTGTLARNPEIKWRLLPDDIARHAVRQKRILEQALRCLKPGGLLVYSTCSLEPEENQEVVDAVAPAKVLSTFQRIPGRDRGDGFWAAVLSS
jgi:16S rRNA (cytosine967-C5)-methyltransferase